jgi:hypothetical protein
MTTGKPCASEASGSGPGRKAERFGASVHWLSPGFDVLEMFRDAPSNLSWEGDKPALLQMTYTRKRFKHKFNQSGSLDVPSHA